MEWNRKLLQDIISWDINTWKRALFCWDAHMDALLPAPGLRVLEIGARGGGVSLYFARKGWQCVCSDRGENFAEAAALHDAYGVSEQVTYVDADCTALPFPEASFDAVVFKSVLGSIGKNGEDARIDAAMAEMLRVLKPGGTLFFAENLAATRMHLSLRRRFNRWGAAWNYLTLARIRTLLANFDAPQLHTYGFWGCFLKDHPLTRVADALCCRKDPSARHYMCYGIAKKPGAQPGIKQQEGEG